MKRLWVWVVLGFLAAPLSVPVKASQELWDEGLRTNNLGLIQQATQAGFLPSTLAPFMVHAVVTNQVEWLSWLIDHPTLSIHMTPNDIQDASDTALNHHRIDIIRYLSDMTAQQRIPVIDDLRPVILPQRRGASYSYGLSIRYPLVAANPGVAIVSDDESSDDGAAPTSAPHHAPSAFRQMTHGSW